MKFRGLRLDWAAAARECESDCWTILEDVYRVAAKEKLQSLDVLSERLCGIVDAAELARHVLPRQQDRQEAEQVFGQLSGLMSVLNTSPALYEAMQEVEGVRDSLSEEDARVLDTTLHELRDHGVHLDDASREQIRSLEGEIGELSYAFGSGDYKALQPLVEARQSFAALLGHSSFTALSLQHRLVSDEEKVRSLLHEISILPTPSAPSQSPPRLLVPLEAALDTLRGFSESVLGVSSSFESSDDRCWAPGVRALKLGPGTVFLDLHSRKEKSHQAATFMTGFETERGGEQSCALVADLGPEGSMLGPGELRTLFHEWGHVLAAILGRTRGQQMSGTRTPEFDFVETPSLLLERLLWHPDMLPQYGNVEASAVALHRGIHDSISHQIRLALLDFDLHGNTPLKALNQSECAKFTHLASYPASYYTYLMCNVFAGNLEHICLGQSLSGGHVLRDKLLVHAGARNPLTMMHDCLDGADPFNLDHFY